MKKNILWLLSAMMLTSINTFAQEDHQEPRQITLTEAERQLVQNNNKFALDLFRKARDTQRSTSDVQPSMLLSPLSITIDLGMLNNGADGITREEIDAVLGSKDVGGADVINQFCRKLLDESGNLDEKTRVAIANNIYVNTASGCQLLPAFVETARQYYDATPESRDFNDGQTRDVINQWGSDHTEGMIEEAIKEGEFNPDAMSYLLNALYFKGEWTHKFNAQETRRHQFDEGRAEVQMMHQESDFSYSENKVYQSVILPYGNMAYQMTVFLPRRGRTIDDVLDELDKNKWQQADYDPCKVNLYLPRFETSTDMRLEDIMKALGMPNAFEYGYGFNKFCDINVYIGMMKQVAKIKLDEEGTEASAVTVIEVDKYSSGPSYAEFVADRPFIYVISERSTGAVFFIGQYMGEPLKNVRHDISLTAEERELVESNNDFAFRLFDKARGNESTVLSPLSITYALGMMNNGAAGTTQEQINAVLGFKDAGADGINNFCRKMLTEAPTLDEETTAEIANTIYVNSGSGYELQQGFVDKANQFYDAEPQALNFYNVDETVGIINQWANEHTHGMIPKVFDNADSFNQDAASYLLNALYFKGVWANKFDKENTRNEAFNGGNEVPMMCQTEEFEYTEDDVCQAIRLPYGNGAYLMTVFLPREGKTIGDVLAGMNGHNWQFKSDGLYMVNLKMPRLKTDTSLPLVKIMSDLGMPAAFGEGAEFPYFGNRDIFIGNMFQKAVIDLNEEGTEAAAVTVIEVTESCLPREATFHANRPFFYVISEQSTGIIFFMGQYTGESVETNIEGQTASRSHADGKRYDLTGRRVGVSCKPGLYIVDGRKLLVR